MTISLRLAARKGFKSLGSRTPGARRQLIALLRRAKLAPEIPAAELPHLAEHVEVFSIASGTAVFREGDAGTWLAILAQGGVEIQKIMRLMSRRLRMTSGRLAELM
jgi:CRP-like cAMP-binding protein